VAAYDTTKELIIDPLITAFFIGENEETSAPKCMTADNEGNIYVAGFSASSYAIYKFDSRIETMPGSVLFGSLANINRANCPNIYDMAIDAENNIYVTGYTDYYDDFPITENAFDGNGGGEEGFVTKFNSDLNQMLASTFIGTEEDDRAHALAIDQDGNVYVTGQTQNPVTESNDATPFPTSSNAYDTDTGEYLKIKAFVMMLDSELQTMLASTLLGYNGEDDFLLDDIGYDITIDQTGDIIVAGITEAEAFPITDGCADSTFQGEQEMFIAKFDPDLQTLLVSTFLGGLNNEKPNALAVDSSNEIFIAGWTTSSDFPVITDNYDTTYNLYEDGFVTKLNNNLTQVIASTFLGGEGADQVSDLFINAEDTIILAGGTGSANFPTTTDAHDTSFNGGDSDDFYKGDGFYHRI
jgi:hypothetical protein